MPALTDIGYIRDLLSRHGFHFSKALGQNFLVNPSVCPRMAEACGASAETGVLEIGAGIGVLTRELASRAGKVVCVEVDDRLPPILEETLAGLDNAEIVLQDIMKVDIHPFMQEKFGDRPVSVCANLPYYITSPVIMGLLESRYPFTSITVMVQKEAAQRLCAEPGTRDAGAVTMAVRYFAHAEKLFDVSRGSFTPSPNVDSAVIRLTLHNSPQCTPAEEKRLFSLVRAAFGQRRKTLSNSLAGAGIPKAELPRLLEAAGISPTARAEQLTLDDFIRLTKACMSRRTP
ncbi:MAG: 16S rRNA (adenine(1518)-N(6)/adenine(1519)-N(6))-dimethyltransferase RsmA [Clostridia bacterium]|nr:16S rRNA (adenine(1518)-N(6)/adenine(1519)-N(6))-dimethyltransferase RsmA [Clostridia bacterium]